MSSKAMKRCVNLLEIGRGLASRLVHFGSHLPTSVLGDGAVQKVVKRIESKFPDLKSLDKSAGYDVFVTHASTILQDFQPLATLIREVLEYNTVSLQTMTDLSQAMGGEFDYLMSRNYCLTLLSMLALQIKLNIILARISDAKKLFGLYTAASDLVTHSSDPLFDAHCGLLLALDNYPRFFIDTFAPLQGTFASILKQLNDTVAAGADSASLRSACVLRVLTPGIPIETPLKRNLNSIKAISIFSELADFGCICEDILYSFIALPVMFYNIELFDIFRLIGSDTLSLHIHNGLTLNVHEEFNAIMAIYPARGDKFECPKGFNIKSALKDVAKNATKMCGLRHINKRADLKEELDIANKLIASCPGVLGPKLPQIISSASLAKSEVMSYFRHLREETRSDCKKHLDPLHFKTGPSDLPSLLKELMNLTQFVREGQDIIAQYYVEYFNGPDASALERLHEDVASYGSDSMKEMLVSVIQDMRSLRAQDVLHALANPEASSTTDSGTMASRIRLRCEQLQAYVIQKSGTERSAPIPSATAFELVKRLRGAVERSLYIDSLESKVIPLYFEPIELWYFHDYFLDSYLRTMREFSIESAAIVSYFRIPEFAVRNLHAECPEETHLLLDAAVSVTDQMSLELASHFTALLRTLEAKFGTLDAQLYPIEAAYRAERSLIAKKSGKTYVEPLPGSESKSWAIASIRDQIYIRAIIVAFLDNAKRQGLCVVYNREYSILDLLRVQVESYLSTRAFELFDTDVALPMDLSTAIRSFGIVCDTAQMVMSCLNIDFSSILREFLFVNYCPIAIPPPGAPIPIALQEPKENISLVWLLSKRVIALIDRMTIPKADFVWVPSLKTIAKKHQHPHAHDDIKELCSFFGPQGVRVVNYRIGRYIADKCREIKTFLITNSATLSELRRDYCTTITAASKLQRLDSFTQSIISIGAAFAVRDMFIESLKEVEDALTPGVVEFVSSVLGSVDNWARPAPAAAASSSICQLGLDLGIKAAGDDKEVSLQRILRSVIFDSDVTEESMRLFELLPVALATTFVSDRWDHVTFDAAKTAFDGNEHTLALAVPKLIDTILGIDVGLSSALSPLLRVRESAEMYVEIASYLLVVMRMQEADAIYRFKPLRAMTSVLEASVLNFPSHVADRLVLEKNFPYAMMHSDNMDLALGRQKLGDKIDISLFEVHDHENGSAALASV